MSINLSKNQSINLTKSDGSSLARVRMGLGWDMAKGSGGGFLSRIFGGDGDSIDLDASVIAFDNSGKKVEAVYFGNLNAFGGAIKHTGDNRTGEGDGDDESIVVELNSLPSHVTHLVFTVNSYTGQNFDKIASAHCRLMDASSGREVEFAKINLSATGNHTGMAMAAISRSGNGWKMKSISEICNGRTVRDIEETISRTILHTL